MIKVKVSVHSCIDIITNSSTEIYVVDSNIDIDILKGIFKEKCVATNEMDWYNSELSIYRNEDSTITIYSFLNAPDWFNSFVEIFKVVSYD